jgi:HEAT repeat protein
MKPHAVWFLLALALVLALAFPPGRDPEVAPAAGPPPRATKGERPGGTPAARTGRTVPVDTPRGDEAHAAIHDAVVTYSPAGVRAIRPFLTDPDPALRQAARDGMVQLGESDAIPFLREAATRLDDPAEKESLRAAADLLALPSWSETPEARDAVAEIREANAR